MYVFNINQYQTIHVWPLQVDTLAMSFMYRMKTSGPDMDPGDTARHFQPMVLLTYNHVTPSNRPCNIPGPAAFFFRGTHLVSYDLQLSRFVG